MGILDQEEWKEMCAEAHTIEKPFLHLYRVILIHPFRIYSFFLLFCLISIFSKNVDISEIGAIVLFLGVAPFFQLFGLRFILWVCLRARGFPKDYLRMKG